MFVAKNTYIDSPVVLIKPNSLTSQRNIQSDRLVQNMKQYILVLHLDFLMFHFLKKLPVSVYLVLSAAFSVLSKIYDVSLDICDKYCEANGNGKTDIYVKVMKK